MKNQKRKGISPVLATIILLAVTVAVGVGVASYVFGLFGSYSQSSAVKIQGTPTLVASTHNFTVTLANAGAASDTVSTMTTVVNGTTYSATASVSAVAGGGGTTTLYGIFNGATAMSAGSTYQVQMSMKSGALLSVMVTAS